VQKPLSEHIARLEEKIINLRRELRDTTLAAFQRNEREIALSNSEEALRLFRRAFDLEEKVARSGLPPAG